MNDEKKQELLELFSKTSYMKYCEIVYLIKSFMPERLKLIMRMMEDDIRQFKLKVYYWERQGYGGPFPLLKPEYVTEDTLEYYVPQPVEQYASFWVLGHLSTQEVKDWLQTKGIDNSFCEMNNTTIYDNAKLPDHSHNLTTDMKKTHLQQQKLPKPELTQKDAAKLAGVDIRTIRSWDKGERTPLGYPGRHTTASFLMFVADRENRKRLKKEVRNMNRARPGGYTSEAPDNNDDDDFYEEEEF